MRHQKKVFTRGLKSSRSSDHNDFPAPVREVSSLELAGYFQTCLDEFKKDIPLNKSRYDTGECSTASSSGEIPVENAVNPCKCKKCGLTCESLDELGLHMKTVHGSGAFECSLCGIPFFALEMLRNHTLTHHKDFGKEKKPLSGHHEIGSIIRDIPVETSDAESSVPNSPAVPWLDPLSPATVKPLLATKLPRRLSNTESDGDSGVFSATCSSMLSPRSVLSSPHSSMYSPRSAVMSPYSIASPSQYSIASPSSYTAPSPFAAPSPSPYTVPSPLSYTAPSPLSYEAPSPWNILLQSDVSSPDVSSSHDVTLQAGRESPSGEASQSGMTSPQRLKSHCTTLDKPGSQGYPPGKNASDEDKVVIVFKKDSDGRIISVVKGGQNKGKTQQRGSFLLPIRREAPYQIGGHSADSTIKRNFQPRRLSSICHDCRPSHQDDLDAMTRNGTYSVLMQKEYKNYAGLKVDGSAGVLQAPDSEVQLTIPKGLTAFVLGYVHTDPKPFLHIIPEGECLVAPIADYHCTIMDTKPKGIWFKLQVPHRITNKGHLDKVKVRHGDIYRNVPFTEVPNEDCHFEVDEHYITIFTRHFSQFICTSCDRVCHGDGKAFIFGGISPLGCNPRTAKLRVYTCSPLFTISDYRQKLVQLENSLGRRLVEQVDMEWDPQVAAEAERVYISVRPQRWDPRLPISRKQTWNASARTLIHTKNISAMKDMLQCHSCKLEPSVAADFSFTQPEPAEPRPVGEGKFSGLLDMFFSSGVVFMESHVDIYPSEVGKDSLNEDHLHLRDVTKLLICTDMELVDFGLHLGLNFNEIKQKRTNHPNCIELAAMDVVTEWWDTCPDGYYGKVQKLVDGAEKIGKDSEKRRVRRFFKRVPNEGGSGTNNDDRAIAHSSGRRRARRTVRNDNNPRNGTNSPRTEIIDLTDSQETEDSEETEVKFVYSSSESISEYSGSASSSEYSGSASSPEHVVPGAVGPSRFWDFNTNKTKRKYNESETFNHAPKHPRHGRLRIARTPREQENN